MNLIALLRGSWETFLSGLEEENRWVSGKIKNPELVFAKEWEASLSQLENIEIALFQPGLLEVNDQFSGLYRRFIQVGNSPEERLQNLFELGFEKDYNSVIFVEEFMAINSTKKIYKAINFLNESDMVFGPNEDGSLYLWGMKKRTFWNWSNFNFQSPEAIVELLSSCNEIGLSYKVLPVFNKIEAETEFRRLLTPEKP